MNAEKFRVYLLFGEDSTIADRLSGYDPSHSLCQISDEEVRGQITEIAYDTAAELKAFTEGVEIACGYLHFQEFDTLDEATRAVRDIIREWFECAEEGEDDGQHPDEEADA